MHPHPALLGAEKYESSFGVLGSRLIMILKHAIDCSAVAMRPGQQFTNPRQERRYQSPSES